MAALVTARLAPGESLGDRILKVVHAGEHGAVNIYRGQRLGARLSCPALGPELADFQVHEEGHRARFAAELALRGRRRCRSFLFCGAGGLALGLVTGLLGRGAIAVTTVAVERVVLRHLDAYRAALAGEDPSAHSALSAIYKEEKAHHDRFAVALPRPRLFLRLLDAVVAGSTEAVIWAGMHL